MKIKAYSIIIKVNSNKFVKYRSNNLINFFTKFLLQKYPESRFANIYDKKSKKLIGSWGSKKGLVMSPV